MKRLYLDQILSFIRRDFLIDSSYRLQFLLSTASIFISVYVFFYFSKFFQGESSYLNVYSNDYFFFLIIGVCMMDLIFRVSIAMNTEIRNYQLTGIFDELINLPTPLISLLLYSHFYPICMSLFRTTLYLFFAIAFFDLQVSYANLPAVLLAILLSLFSFIGIGMLAGAYAMIFKKGNPLSSLNRFSVMILGGVFFPTTVLPDWLYIISKFIPITHSLDLMRGLLVPDQSLNDIIISKFLILFIFAVVLLVLGYITCKIAINYGKKNGTLSFY